MDIKSVKSQFPIFKNKINGKQLIYLDNANSSQKPKSVIDRISKCRFLISDSGGVQEEASFLKKRVIICRETTERPETLGLFHSLCPNAGDLPKIFNEFVSDYEPTAKCPFGDGKATEKILQVL